jgi:hypothetical protein
MQGDFWRIFQGKENVSCEVEDTAYTNVVSNSTRSSLTSLFCHSVTQFNVKSFMIAL